MDNVIVLDFGSQYTQLIARRIRELGVHSEIIPCHAPVDPRRLSAAKAIVLSGGPNSVTDANRPKFDFEWISGEQAVLGICYGMQLLALQEKGRVESSRSREYGHADFRIQNPGTLFEGFEQGGAFRVWMSHGDHVSEIPEGYELLGVSDGAPIAAIGDEKRKRYALQFHPEVAHTDNGIRILENFLFRIAGIEGGWNAESFIEAASEQIAEQVPGESAVICGLSGGVDSSVAAVLVHKVVGDRLHCIFVNNGLCRQDETEEVISMLGPDGLGLPVHVAEAEDRFLRELKGVTEPEEKRKIIGRVFIEVFEEEAKKIPNAHYLVQGTLYPDVIESVSAFGGPSTTIKSHHNVGGLPEKMDLELVEPLRDLFKDEVRAFGRKLGIPENVLMRQPFPGPGLGVRILGEVTAERLEVLRKADAIFIEEVRAAGYYEKLWQSFAVLLPVQTVGVMGDARTYEQVIALRAVTSLDGMTADWEYLPRSLLSRVSNRIINEVAGINRVVLDISSKPPATIEWE